MSLFLLAKGFYDGESLEPLFNQADFRRATRNMCLAYYSMKKCVDSLGKDWPSVQSCTGAVLGTSHGELNATAEFLEAWGKSRTARPLAFQSSLHNATIGFLAKQFGIMGPTLTVSDGLHTGREALETACLLLSSQTVPFCFVTGCDLIPEKIKEPFQRMYPPGTPLGEGAATLLLASEQGMRQLGRTGQALEIPQTLSSQSYDSGFIESLARG